MKRALTDAPQQNNPRINNPTLPHASPPVQGGSPSGNRSRLLCGASTQPAPRLVTNAACKRKSTRRRKPREVTPTEKSLMAAQAVQLRQAPTLTAASRGSTGSLLPPALLGANLEGRAFPAMLSIALRTCKLGSKGGCSLSRLAPAPAPPRVHSIQRQGRQDTCYSDARPTSCAVPAHMFPGWSARCYVVAIE
jgi:hypothetical protein